MDIQLYINELLAYWAPGIDFTSLSEEIKTKLNTFAKHKVELLFNFDEYFFPGATSGSSLQIGSVPEEPCLMDSYLEDSPVLPREESDSSLLSKKEACREIEEPHRLSESQRIKREIEERLNLLRALGITDNELAEIFKETFHISPIHVTRDGRLILTDYDNKEVEMGLIEKTLYLLFLRHPEGLYQKDLVDYSGELQDLYRKVNGGTITPRGMNGIGRLINPLDNSCDEKLSHIRKAFSSLFQPAIADTYSVTRGKGELRRIPLETTKIIWE